MNTASLIPSRMSAFPFITPTRPPLERSGRICIGFLREAGVAVRSGITTWSTGDMEFLRNRIVPAYKELALFYEDFLTATDKDGNYIFAPSFSPENNPLNTGPGAMMSVNATMDISVCREVLGNLIEACETLGINADNVPKWKAIVAKLPPHMMEPDGTLKEWAWPTLEERYSHRHVSHLYGAWPGDEIDPDRTPQLALAAMLADRKRVPERLAAHGRCHRALVGARLKDCYMVDTELRQLIEQGYVARTLRCSHDPWAFPMPDAQGGIPTIMMEMLASHAPALSKCFQPCRKHS